jgi:LysR family transcriptional regulator, chromosome initiation inhibitor
VAAVTADPGPLPGCDTLALGALRYIATASPAYLARWFPQGLTPEALAQAPALTFNAKDRLQIDWASRQAGRRISPPTHVIGSSQAFIEAAALGLGWGMNPEPLIRDHLTAGTLVPLDRRAPLDVALYWQSLRAMKGPLTPLTAAVRQAARAFLIPA